MLDIKEGIKFPVSQLNDEVFLLIEDDETKGIKISFTCKQSLIDEYGEEFVSKAVEAEIQEAMKFKLN